MTALKPVIKVVSKLPKNPTPLPTLPVEFLLEFVDYMKEKERQETVRKEVEVELERLKVLKKELKYRYKLKKETLDAFLKKLEEVEGEDLERVLDSILRLVGA